MFCAFVGDRRYGWVAACEDAFWEVPVQACHDWNTADLHRCVRSRPGRSSLTYDELQTFFDVADDLVELKRKRCRKGALAVRRDAVMIRQVYPYRTRRRGTSMLELPELRHSPRSKAYGRFGAGGAARQGLARPEEGRRVRPASPSTSNSPARSSAACAKNATSSRTYSGATSAKSFSKPTQVTSRPGWTGS
ncbi:hypothetical protein P3T27_007238 [Kitasatospora sp. MAA19]|uniref:hypothetical protein n=1 Tax=Kitasatospora sp. MAA19 TaxID=3035090 RepID=UPI002475E029|nr:hypothetical protein [Kitasatospora sp. MAA19]MDH6710488.1 hypothetical protein [Kitasatospora sp. MAA19]